MNGRVCNRSDPPNWQTQPQDRRPAATSFQQLNGITDLSRNAAGLQRPGEAMEFILLAKHELRSRLDHRAGGVREKPPNLRADAWM